MLHTDPSVVSGFYVYECFALRYLLSSTVLSLVIIACFHIFAYEPLTHTWRDLTKRITLCTVTAFTPSGFDEFIMSIESFKIQAFTSRKPQTVQFFWFGGVPRPKCFQSIDPLSGSAGHSHHCTIFSPVGLFSYGPGRALLGAMTLRLWSKRPPERDLAPWLTFHVPITNEHR